MNPKVKNLSRSLVAFIILAGAIGFSSCEKYKILPTPFDPAATWSLSTDIQPVFNASCATASCHGGARSPDLSSGKSYNSLSKGGFVKSPYETSRLYMQMNNSHPSSSFSSTNDKLKIQAWVIQGAKNN
jgi:hypothetical protein